MLLFVISTTHGAIFERKFINAISNGQLRYNCIVAAIEFDGSLDVTGIRGSHLDGKNNQDVQGFAVAGYRNYSIREFKTIPKNITNFFPNVDAIDWISGNLTKITSENLKPFSNLLWLYVSNNNIEQLDSDLFQHAPKMRLVVFYGNKIQHVGLDFIDRLS